MRFRHQRKEDPEINLTSLIDVVFLLLIFFMVSTTFDKTSQINIQLPEASGHPLEKKKFSLEIDIDAQGRYYVNQRRVKDDRISTLKSALRLTLGKHKKPQVIISSDKNTPYQAVVRAMDASRQLGLVNLTFATTQAKDKQ